MKYVHNDEAWARKLEQDYAEYMGECMDSVDDDFVTLSGEPYCGCVTCYDRETITFLIPRIIDAYKAGILEQE